MLYGTESTASAGRNAVSDYVVAVVAAAAAGAASNAPQIISSASIKQFSQPGHCEFIGPTYIAVIITCAVMQ